MICEISTDNLVDERQIGWISYREGHAILSVKVVRAKNNRLFLSHPTAFRRGTKVRIIQYEDSRAWKKMSEYLLSEFKRVVGDDHYYNYKKDS